MIRIDMHQVFVAFVVYKFKYNNKRAIFLSSQEYSHYLFQKRLDCCLFFAGMKVLHYVF